MFYQSKVAIHPLLCLSHTGTYDRLSNMTCVKYFYRITFVIDNRNYILTYTNMYEINVYAIKKKWIKLYVARLIILNEPLSYKIFNLQLYVFSK